MRRIVEYIDRQNPWLSTVVIVVSVILRGILEGSFENARSLHFQTSLYKAFLFFFLHQFSFYFAAFLSLSVLISLVSRKEVVRVFNFVATFSFIIVVPPLLDSMSGGGYMLKYIFSEEEFWKTMVYFFNPFVDISSVGITYGMRLEITLAIAGICVYTFMHTKSVLRSMLGGFFTFFILLFLGSIPYLFLNLFKVSYTAAFKSYSLIYEDTQRYSILNLLVISLSLVVFGFLHNPSKVLTILLLRIQKLPFYISLGMVGFFIGYKMSGHLWPHPFRNPFDYVALVCVLFAVALSHHFGVIVNDINDHEIDRLNSKKTSITSGNLTISEAKSVASILFILALAFYLSLNFDTFLLGLATLGMAWIYSVNPLRTKRIYMVSLDEG